MKSDSIASSAAAEAAPTAQMQAADMLVRPWKEMLRLRGVPTLRYLMRTEGHTFAFSVAAKAILSFFSFLLLLTWLFVSFFFLTVVFLVFDSWFVLCCTLVM